MKTLYDKQLRFIDPFVLFLVGTLFFRLNWYFELPTTQLILSDLIGLSAGYVCWNLARWVALRLQRYYPGLTNTRRRLLWMGLLTPDQTLTSLATELAFIQSYCHLLKTRHGDALRVMWQIAPPLLDRQLPSLTLQLLVENAVKHNIALPNQPLTIAIVTDTHDRLVVRNNVQRKSVRVASNGVGLANIWSKYQMMNQPEPIIHETEGQFEVTLPLI